MQRIIIDIPDNKINFFLELINNLGLKKVKRLTKTQKLYTDGITDALNEVDKHLQGKKKLQNAKDFLNEV